MGDKYFQDSSEPRLEDHLRPSGAMDAVSLTKSGSGYEKSGCQPNW